MGVGSERTGAVGRTYLSERIKYRTINTCGEDSLLGCIAAFLPQVLQRNIEDLKAGPLSLGDAQRKLFEMFYRRVLPARMLVPVTDSYLSHEDRTDWGLLNALTLHAKNLPPGPNMRAHIRIGRYFGLGKADPYACEEE
jgi:hypothetical protein